MIPRLLPVLSLNRDSLRVPQLRGSSVDNRFVTKNRWYLNQITRSFMRLRLALAEPSVVSHGVDAAPVPL